MRLAPFIAGRYLSARKSHNVINVISAISALGMAVGTAALVVILSVYNGFDGLIKSNMNDTDAELSVRSSDGKRFDPRGGAFETLYGCPGLASVGKVLEENIFMIHEGNQAIARAKGVDSVFESSSGIASHLVSGSWRLHKGELPLAALGTELAAKLGADPSFRTTLSLYYPSTGVPFSPANPAASLKSSQILPGSILSINASMDSDLLILPIESLASLLGCSGEVSSLDLRFPEGTSSREIKKYKKEFSSLLGPSYKVLDRYEQHSTLYRMMRLEKAAIWLILVFVVFIVALNIFGSLSMLMIEKEEDMDTLRAMGADESLIRRIFVLEGWMISLLGMAAGAVTGVVLVILQQRFGFVKMPGGSFIVNAYPVALQWNDVLLTAVSVAAIGLLVALAPSPGSPRARRG